MDLRLAVFDRIESQSLAYFDRNPTGRLMTRVGSDVEVLQELFSSGAITIFGDLFTVIGVVARDARDQLAARAGLLRGAAAALRRDDRCSAAGCAAPSAPSARRWRG